MPTSLPAPIRRAASSRNADLWLVLCFSLAVVPPALLTDGALRVALAVPFIIFSPGYALIAALYPRADSLDGIERLALSFGTSIAVVPLLGLVLNYTPWGIRLIPIMVSVEAFIVAACAVAWLKRRRLLPHERFGLTLVRPRADWRAMQPIDRALSLALVASIVFAVGVLVFVIAAPRQGEEFTEFYILGTEGRAEGYPATLRTGEPAGVILGIVNHEGETLSYRVEARLGGDPATARLSAPGTSAVQEGESAIIIPDLADEQEWEGTVSLTALAPGEKEKLELLLFMPKPRTGYYLRALLGDDGYASLELDEAGGTATVTLDAGDLAAHDCRIEAWQGERLAATQSVRVEAGEDEKLTLRYPAGRTQFRLYDGDALVLDDTGAALSLHLWTDVAG